MLKDMTTATANERNSLGAGWITVLLGGWLVISPFVLGFSHITAGIANNISVGIAIILLSVGGVKQGLLRAMIVLMGAWLYASAVILYVPVHAFFWNNLILAGVVVVSAVVTEA